MKIFSPLNMVIEIISELKSVLVGRVEHPSADYSTVIACLASVDSSYVYEQTMIGRFRALH